MEESRGFEWIQDEPNEKIRMKRKTTSKKEFVGWGSKQVIAFLRSIGYDTKMEKISQYDVTDIINKYVNDNNLVIPGKKKRILCDDKLHALFGRKSIGRIKIYDLLELHFAENHDNDADSIDEYSNEDGDDKDTGGINSNDKEATSIKSSSSSIKLKKQGSGTAVTTPKLNCFAAIIPENINLIYLRRCVVQDILKEVGAFQTIECKLVGSLVRIKSNPYDYRQLNSHMLIQVTGVKKTSGADDKNIEIILQVANYIKDVTIDMLTDEYFSEEELTDFHQRCKDGKLKRPTVLELEQKAKVLHQDITKHWIARELSLLQIRIDRANEKGWRREFVDYCERRDLLRRPGEQSRLLMEVPKVIAEEIAQEQTLDNSGVEKQLQIPSINEVSETFTNPLNNISEVTGEQVRSEECVDDDEDKSCSVIELIEDDISVVDYDTENAIWHYMDPKGDIHGPFSLNSLKQWSDAGYFPPEFKIWNNTDPQAPMLLSHLLHLVFPD